MTFTWKEKPNSRVTTYKPPSAQRVYKSYGSPDEMFVLAYALANTGGIIAHPSGLLYRQDLRVQEIAHLAFEVTVPYGPKDRQTGSMRRSFDTTGGTVRIRTSKSTVASYGSSPPNYKQLINVRKDGEVDGVDIVIPTLKRTIEYSHPLGIITDEHSKSIARMTGHVNENPWRTYDAGEVLFLGGAGSDGDDVEANIAYHFAMSESVTGLSIGDIAGIAKDGHDVIWVSYEDYDDGGQPAVQPLGVYVERVYPRSDFASVLGF